MTCRKCGADMAPGIATGQTHVASPYIAGVVSVSHPGGAHLIDCMKCTACDWSVTAGHGGDPKEPMGESTQ